MRYFETPQTTLKDDRSVVTVADNSIEELFAEVCDRPQDNSYLIGEETIGKYPASYINQALKSDCCWVLDPIDGTAPYSAHMELWGVSLGLMKQGKLIEGAVYLPRLDIMLSTDGNDIWSCSLQKRSNWQKFEASGNILDIDGHISLGQYVTRKWGFSGKNTLFSLCSCVGSLFWLVTGRVTAYCGDFKLWDIAGMLPILERAGFAVLTTDGKNRQLSGNLADNMFDLADGKVPWKVKTPVIAAANKTIALALLEKFYIQEENKA